MILHYIITAWRCIMKYKTQNIIAVMGLSVALFCFSICLYIARYFYSTDECFEQRNRIVQFSTQSPETGGISHVTFCDFSDELKKHAFRGVESYVYVHYLRRLSYNIEVTDDKILPYILEVMETDSAYQRVFDSKVLFGSWEQAAHTPNSIILSESVAKRIFGQAGKAVGKQMVLTRTAAEDIPYTVQGVMEDLPKNNSLNFLQETDAWVLNDSHGILNSDYKRSMAGGQTFALLSEGVSQETLCHEVKERNVKAMYFNEEQSIVALPFGKLFWERTENTLAPLIVTIAGVLILLVGMLNFFHFLTGSFVTRIREYSLRRVSGARAWQLWTMLFVQATLLLSLSGLFCMMLMEITSPFLSFDIIRISIDRNVMMAQAGGYLLALWICCMIAAAVVVWRVERISIQRGLFGGGGVYGKHRVRNVLLGIQLFICWIFVSLTLMLYLQSQKSSNALFDTLSQEEKENIYSISMEEYTFLTQEERMNLMAELGKVAGVKALLPAREKYIGSLWSSSIFTQPGRKREHARRIGVMFVSPDFFEFMNMPLQAGVLPKTENEIVVTEGFEKMMEKEMLGQMVYDFDDIGYTITGICHHATRSVGKSNGEDVQTNCIFYPLKEEEAFHCYVKCEPGQKKQVGAALEKILRERLPENIDIQLKTFMDDIREYRMMEFELRGISGFFAIVTLIIVLLGIYAAITLDTEYRRKEMAIRKVNGAGVKQIALIFARLYIWLLVVTFILAFPIVAFAITGFSSMYEVFIDTGVGFYGSIFLGITAIITLTVAFRIYLITKVNPAEIIRKE